MKAMVGSSILENSYEAGVETAKSSLKGLKNPKIGFLFTSEKYNQKELLKGIKSVNNSIKIIGCTSSGAIMTPEGIITSNNGFSGMLTLEDNELAIGVAALPSKEDARNVGREAAKLAMKNAGKKFAPVAFSMFATPGKEEAYLKGIQDVIGEVPMFGGTAADDNFVGEEEIICEDKTFKDGCAVAFFYTTKKIVNTFSGLYEETNNVGIITAVDDDRHVVEIDHVPALKKYAEWTGFNADELMGQNLLFSSVPLALGVKTIQGDITAVRHPITGNPDYTFTVGAKMSENTAVIQLKTDVEGLIDGTAKTIKELTSEIDASAILLVHSGGRKLYIKDRIDEDFVAIKNTVGDIPFIVVFTSAEYGAHNHSGTIVSNLSLSFTAFGK